MRLFCQIKLCQKKNRVLCPTVCVLLRRVVVHGLHGRHHRRGDRRGLLLRLRGRGRLDRGGGLGTPDGCRPGMGLEETAKWLNVQSSQNVSSVLEETSECNA